MPFEWFIALRFLREGKSQTTLIFAGVSVGVAVIVFLSALIDGLQTNLIRQTLGSQAHIVVRPLEDTARQLSFSEGAEAVRTEKTLQRARSLLQWQPLAESLRQRSGVLAVSPTVAGSAFAVRGSISRSIALRGVDAQRFSEVIDFEGRLKEGRYRISGIDALIGTELAKELGVSTGDKIRLVTAEGRQDVFTVSGIFDLGNKDVNARWVLVSIRSAQTLLQLEGGISTLELKIEEIFQADALAQQLANDFGLIADSWMKTNAQLLVALRSQSSSRSMIQFFVIVAVALGIASVLVVSVVQKSKEIGILKAMGARTGRIMRVFLVQGAVVGVVGALLGCIFGSGLAIFFANLAKNAEGKPLFPVDLNVNLFVTASLVALVTGLLAAVAPARRAAKLDPAVAIRNG